MASDGTQTEEIRTRDASPRLDSRVAEGGALPSWWPGSNPYVIGDCLEIMRGLPDESVDLILTDPPYKVSQMYGGGVDADNLVNVASILRTIPEMARVLKPGRFAVLFYDNRILPFLFEAVKGTDLVYRRSIFLYRRWGNANRWHGWMQCTDPICFFVKGHIEPFDPELRGDVRHDTFIKDKPESFDTGHPAQKPLQLILDIVKWCSNGGEIVLDPYLGSGIVLKAARELNRVGIGCEINPDYEDIIKKSLSFANTGLDHFAPPEATVRAGRLA